MNFKQSEMGSPRKSIKKKEKVYVPPTGITDSAQFKMKPFNAMKCNTELVPHLIDQENFE